MSEAPKFSGFYKIVQPAPETTRVTDNQSLTDAGIYGNYSWYQRLVQGSGSRITRYREYDLMDVDVDVARALDTIAEEITGNDKARTEPLQIDFEVENSATVSSTTAITLRAALKRWLRINHMSTRLYKIVRLTIKYGDCYFRKSTKTGRWEFIHPKHVVGAIVDRTDVTKVIGWQIRTHQKDAKSTYGVPLQTSSLQDHSEIVPATEIVWFSLNDDMSDTAPFGESLLRPVYRAHKQKELLEDAVIIYRIQRAPERRVFYIDVGKMPPQRVKQYLEQIKNEIKQKKVPTSNGGTDQVDSVYNPQSMSEDFFFAQRADGRGSRVDTLPGGAGLGELSDLEYFMDKVMRGLRIPQSYMFQRETGTGGMFNDGRVGVAYIEELRFALFVMRLQVYFEETLDHEFKLYLRQNNIIVNNDDWRLRLPEPSNFGIYRQQELDAALLNGFAQADQVDYLSKRFILERYLRLDTDEILRNEELLRQEKAIDLTGNPDEDLKKLYRGDDMMDDMDMGGLGGGMAGGTGMTAGTLGGESPGEGPGEGPGGGEGPGAAPTGGPGSETPPPPPAGT